MSVSEIQENISSVFRNPVQYEPEGPGFILGGRFYSTDPEYKHPVSYRVAETSLFIRTAPYKDMVCVEDDCFYAWSVNVRSRDMNSSRPYDRIYSDYLGAFAYIKSRTTMKHNSAIKLALENNWSELLGIENPIVCKEFILPAVHRDKLFIRTDLSVFSMSNNTVKSSIHIEIKLKSRQGIEQCLDYKKWATAVYIMIPIIYTFDLDFIHDCKNHGIGVMSIDDLGVVSVVINANNTPLSKSSMPYLNKGISIKRQ